MKPFFIFVQVNSEEEIQLQFNGFLNTPQLWCDSRVYGIGQIHLTLPEHKIDIEIPEIRLGKRVEQFYSSCLEALPTVDILKQNFQVKKGLITIGEIDYLTIFNGVPTQIELVYKFYLFDPSEGKNELDHWIGPNRKDCLRFKLDKLLDKQLPMLFNESNKSVLNDLNLQTEEILQFVDFRAQLFIPIDDGVSFTDLNKACVVGFYYRLNELPSEGEYFLPSKNNWLVQPHNQVAWMNYTEGITEINSFLSVNKSPLCWIKSSTGEIEKCFIVWW